MPGQSRRQAVAPAVDGGTGCAGLIAEIVAISHEGVHRAHGILLLGREQDERVVEISGAFPGDDAAVRVRLLERGHAARRKATLFNATLARVPISKPARSTFEILGRRERTS